MVAAVRDTHSIRSSVAVPRANVTTNLPVTPDGQPVLFAMVNAVALADKSANNVVGPADPECSNLSVRPIG
jgi:hypothetical protein